MKWIVLHRQQLLVLLASLGVGCALHFHRISPDEAIALASALAAVGIHLPAIVYGKVPS